MVIQPVRRTRAYENIVSQLTDMIRGGEIRPGDRLSPERELAAAFGVGRPTLRQALSVLTQAGILEVRPGCGVYLAGPLSDTSAQTSNNPLAMVLMAENVSLQHILELRIGVESEAAYLAARRREPAHIAKLSQALENLDQALRSKGSAIHEDYQFHYAVAEATCNPVFVKVMASLADLFMQGVQESTRHLYKDPGRHAVNRVDHMAILNAISEQRPDDARKAMARHLTQVLVRLNQTEKLSSLR